MKGKIEDKPKLQPISEAGLKKAFPLLLDVLIKRLNLPEGYGIDYLLELKQPTAIALMTSEIQSYIYELENNPENLVWDYNKMTKIIKELRSDLTLLQKILSKSSLTPLEIRPGLDPKMPEFRKIGRSDLGTSLQDEKLGIYSIQLSDGTVLSLEKKWIPRIAKLNLDDRIRLFASCLRQNGENIDPRPRSKHTVKIGGSELTGFFGCPVIIKNNEHANDRASCEMQFALSKIISRELKRLGLEDIINVVHTYGTIRQTDTQRLIMEQVDGKSLSQHYEDDTSPDSPKFRIAIDRLLQELIVIKNKFTLVNDLRLNLIKNRGNYSPKEYIKMVLVEQKAIETCIIVLESYLSSSSNIKDNHLFYSAGYAIYYILLNNTNLKRGVLQDIKNTEKHGTPSSNIIFRESDGKFILIDLAYLSSFD